MISKLATKINPKKASITYTNTLKIKLKTEEENSSIAAVADSIYCVFRLREFKAV
jgi:hypothetical protein